MIRFLMALAALLLALQLVTCHYILSCRRGRPPVHRVYSDDLLGLAQLTNACWEDTVGFDADPREGEGVAGGLVFRETLVLSLRDLEAELEESGCETKLADDLKAWLEASGRGVQSYRLNTYINDLCAWVESFSHGNGSCHLDRLALHPESHSAFPAIAFELIGSPGSVARGFPFMAARNPRWCLDELDIFNPGLGGDWWMRGSLSFVSGAGP